MRRRLIAIALALSGGCAASSTAPPSGTYDAACVMTDRVRHERGDPDRALPDAGPWTRDLTIEDGALQLDGCALPLLGYDGERFDVGAADCDGASYTDGWGRLTATDLNVTLDVTIDDGNGWTETATIRCEGSR